jgi:hypothetical protein
LFRKYLGDFVAARDGEVAELYLITQQARRPNL